MNKSTIRNLCPDMHSGGTPSTKHPEYWNGDIPWLSSAESGNEYINHANQFITQAGVENSATKYAEKGSIIIATAGEGKTRGQVSFLNIGTYINQSLIAMKTDEKTVLTKYLYYYLKNSYFKLRSLSDITGIRGSLSGALLGNYEISYPNLEVQQSTVSLLSAIDDKISTNNAIISELESMAKDIYDYWFVQFDFPDENGKPYKSSGGKMIWCEELKREIPEGWKACELSEIGQLSNRSITPASGTLYEHYSIPAFDENHHPAFEDGSSIESGKYVVEKDAILVSKLNPQFPRVWNPLMLSDKAICSTEFLVLTPATRNGKAFLYRLMKSSAIEKAMIMMATCSTGSRKRVQPEACMSIKTVKPSDSVVDHFSSIISPLIEKQKRCEMENAELKSLRDWLLPMLMNGQVKVGGKA